MLKIQPILLSNSKIVRIFVAVKFNLLLWRSELVCAYVET